MPIIPLSDPSGRVVSSLRATVNAGRFPSGADWIGPALALGTFLLYLKSGRFEFLLWDDYFYVARNSYVLMGLTWEGASRAWLETAHYFMPLAWWSFMANVSLTGPDPGGLHLVNAAIHAVNVWLLFHWLRRTTTAWLPSAFVAAAFACHPMHVEAVAWISERKEVQAATFGLIALILYTRYAAGRKESAPGGQTSYLLSVLFFLFSLLTKPMWVTLPLLLLLLDYWPLQRRDRTWLGLWREKLPYLVGSLLVSIGTITAFFAQFELASWDRLPLSLRVGNGLVAAVTQVLHTFYPVGLAAHYPFPMEPMPIQATLAGGLLLVGSLAILAVRGHHPWLTTGWFWFLIALLPVSGLITGGVLIARSDRGTYLPHIGLFIALAWGGSAWGERGKWRNSRVARTLLTGAGLLLLGFWTVTSNRYLDTWRTTETLWQNVVATSPDNLFAHWQLGMTYQRDNRMEAALPHLLTAWNGQPNDHRYAATLGDAWLQLGDRLRAAQCYRAILQDRATPVTLLATAGYVMYMNDLPEEARLLWTQALTHPPTVHSRAHLEQVRFFLALLDAAHRDDQTGIRRLEAALPDHPTTLPTTCRAAGHFFRGNRLPHYPDDYRDYLARCPPTPDQ